MKYKLLEKTESITVITQVEFTFNDNSTIIVDIAHFNPQNNEEIEKNIQNRYDSECIKKELDKE